MSNIYDDELRKCPFCGYIMTKPFPKICPNPTCLQKIDDISRDTFSDNILTQNKKSKIRKMYEPPKEGMIETDRPRDIRNIEVSTANAANTIKGVTKKPKDPFMDVQADVIVIPTLGQYFKNIGVARMEERDPIYNKNPDFNYLQELSINLDYIASSIIGGEIDRLLLLSDISNAVEKVLYIKKDGLIYFLYGQFPDKQGYWILNNLRTELYSSLRGRNINQLSSIDWHELKLRFPSKVQFVLERYAEAASDVITEHQIPSVAESLRFDYFGMSYQSIGTISKLLGKELIQIRPEEDEATAIDMMESGITAKIEAIAANTIANTQATPQYLSVKLGYQKYRYLLFEKLGSEYFIYMLAEGNLKNYKTVAQMLREMVEPYTYKPFRGDLKPFIELKKQVADFFQIRTF